MLKEVDLTTSYSVKNAALCSQLTSNQPNHLSLHSSFLLPLLPSLPLSLLQCPYSSPRHFTYRSNECSLTSPPRSLVVNVAGDLQGRKSERGYQKLQFLISMIFKKVLSWLFCPNMSSWAPSQHRSYLVLACHKSKLQGEERGRKTPESAKSNAKEGRNVQGKREPMVAGRGRAMRAADTDRYPSKQHRSAICGSNVVRHAQSSNTFLEKEVHFTRTRFGFVDFTSGFECSPPMNRPCKAH